MTDTVKLLRECDAGTKMAVASIDELLDKASDPSLAELLTTSKQHHERLGNKIHGLLTDYKSDDKDPAPMAKSMSWMKTNWKMNIGKSDATIADLITDGCNMGVKSLYRYLNEYCLADDTSKNICGEIINIEEQLAEELRTYL